MKLRLGIDIDGVLYPWADAANEAVMERFGIADPGPHTTWDHLESVVTPEQYKWVWSPEGMRQIFGKKKSYPGVEAFSWLLEQPTLECHFVTHRAPAVLADITADYLHWLFPDQRWEGLHITKSTDKTAILDWDSFIDDKPSTVLDMVTCSVRTFMPNRPWNSIGWVPDGLTAYDDPQDVVDILEARVDMALARA